MLWAPEQSTLSYAPVEPRARSVDTWTVSVGRCVADGQSLIDTENPCISRRKTTCANALVEANPATAAENTARGGLPERTVDGVDIYDTGDDVTGEALQLVNAVDCTLTSTK